MCRRAGVRKTANFVSDSAPVTKAAVRDFMAASSNEYCFMFAVNFCQLAMIEAEFQYLNVDAEEANVSDYNYADESG